MAATRRVYHGHSCSYFNSSKKRKEAKGWQGPVFANEMGVGWTKLNAVRACSKCRVRHVKCSLIHTGGPCTHCRKRKETCEVLGWQLEPEEASKTIYKYVLPPPKVPSATPNNSDMETELDQQLDLEELCQRLEQLRPRRLASLWPWGPDDHEPFYPLGPQFGEEHHDECWACCPARQLNELKFCSPSENGSFSPAYSSELDCPLSSSSSGKVPFGGEYYDSYSQIQPSGAPSTCSQDDSNHHRIDQIKYPFSNKDQNPHRMSLSFILNPEEANFQNNLQYRNAPINRFF